MPSRSVPSPDAAELARELLDVALRLTRLVAAEVRRSHPQLVPGQLGILFRLLIAPATVSDLARYLGVSLPTVSKSLGVLVQRGWIERWVDAANRRQTIVRLTPAGRRVTAGMRRQVERHLAAQVRTLADDRRGQLRHTLESLHTIFPAPSCAQRGGPSKK